MWCKRYSGLLLIVMGLSLGACRSLVPPLPDTTPPEISPDWVERSHETNILSTMNDDKATQHEADLEALAQWWTHFEDPLLTAWVSEALEQNKDIQVAWARLREVQAMTRANRTVLWPSLDIGFSAERRRNRSGGGSDSNENTLNSTTQTTDTDIDLDVSADLPLDIFGQKRAQIKAVGAEEAVALAQAQAVALTTITTLVREYYQYRGLQKRIRMTEQNTELLRESMSLIQTRQQVGEASEFDVSRARGEYQLSGARLPELEGALRVTRHGLSVLLGQSPGAIGGELGKRVALPSVRPKVPLGARASLISRRPDLRVAQAELDVRLAEFDVSVADMYPTLSLETFFGFRHERVSNLISSANKRWSAGLFLDWSIFQIRTRQHLAKAARERVVAQLLNYEHLVLRGLAEVESAVALYDAALASQARLRAVVKSRQQSQQLARALYEAGEEDYFAVLDAERELVARRDDLVVAETNTLLALTDLYAALGGGWQIAKPSLTPENAERTPVSQE